MCVSLVDWKQRFYWNAEVGQDGIKAGRGVAAPVRAQRADAGIQENETTAQVTGGL